MATPKTCPSCGRVNKDPGWNCASCGARMGGDPGKVVSLKKKEEEPEPFAFWEEKERRKYKDE